MKKTFLTIGTALALIMSISVCSYAAGTGAGTSEAQGAQTEQASAVIVSYTQAQVATLGNWEADPTDPSIYRFKNTLGQYLTNSWLESLTTPGTWYFLDSTGVMLRDTITPDNYPVDSTGAYITPTHSSTPSSSTSAYSSGSTSQSNTDTGLSAPTTPNNNTHSSGSIWDQSNIHGLQGNPDSYIDHNANAGLDLHG